MEVSFISVPIIFLCVLLFLKVILFVGSPSSGLLVKVHPNLSEKSLTSLYKFKTVEGNTWVKTYASLWNKKVSGVHQAPWGEKLDFPLDWVLLSGGCAVRLNDCFEDLNVVIEIEGALLIPKERRFALIARGVKEGRLIATNEHGNSFVLTPAKNFNDAAQSQYHLPNDGRWKISGKFSYSGPDWSLIPVLVENNGQVTKDLGRGVLWQSDDELSSSSGRIGFYKFFSIVVDGGIVIFLLTWIVSTITHMIQKQILNLPLFIFSVSAICIPFVMASSKVFFYERFLGIVRILDPARLVYIGVSIIIAGIGFCCGFEGKKITGIFRSIELSHQYFCFLGRRYCFSSLVNGGLLLANGKIGAPVTIG